MNYDIIGDIHGHADKLEELLSKLGYEPDGLAFRPPAGRQAVFLGDLIDRGPKQLRVIEIVMSMVQLGWAHCIMGNHEFNAIAYITPDPREPNENYRPNRQDTKKTEKNRKQHAEFLRQVGEGSLLHLAIVQWFRSLPVCLDLGGLRVVHGCWDQQSVNALRSAGWKPGRLLDNDLMAKLHEKDANGQESDLMRARKLLTCGLELPLPDGREIEVNDHKFDNVRIANWRHWAKEFAEVALLPSSQRHLIADMDWPAYLVIDEIQGAPVFVGHHWFSGHPAIESEKLACLDWSVAKNGKLVCYRWDGEQTLSNNKLAWV